MFRHIGVVVKDLNRQIYFYKELLGFEIMYSKLEQGIFLETISNIKNVKINILKLGKGGKTVVELLDFENSENETSKNLNQTGITHFALTVENLDNLYDYLEKNGVEFLSSPTINEERTHKVCFCRDFDGNFLELVEVL